MTAPREVYEACAEASWEAPGTQRLWPDVQRETYIELMMARPDWRALVDTAYRAGRQDAARDIEAHADTFAPKDGNATQQRVRRHLLVAARVAAGPPTMAEIAEALAAGNYAVCHLDEAGRPVDPDG
jgi:hypothetical protein